MSSTLPAAHLLIDLRTKSVASRHRTAAAAEKAGYKLSPSGSFVVIFGRQPVGATVER